MHEKHLSRATTNHHCDTGNIADHSELCAPAMSGRGDAEGLAPRV